MTGWELSDEHEAFRTVVRDFAQRELAPHDEQWDREQHFPLDAVRAILRPGLPFRELNATLLAYYRDTGLWERRGWIGGYEMGIAFAPDWVGNVVFDPLSAIDADRDLAPGTCLNCETQVFLPRHVGQFFAIETILCDGATAATMSDVPFGLCVV